MVTSVVDGLSMSMQVEVQDVHGRLLLRNLICHNIIIVHLTSTYMRLNIQSGVSLVDIFTYTL